MSTRVFLSAFLLSAAVVAAGCVVEPYPPAVAVGPPVIYGAPGVALEIGSPVYVGEYERRYGCCFHQHYEHDGGGWHRRPRS
jgi:hypothetical protein